MSLIQVTLVVPSLLTLAMGVRTRKMSASTVVLVACYWLVAGIETADLIAIDIVTTATASLHPVVSTAAIIAIASILSSSYAVVTLCSFISPTDSASTTASRRRFPTFDGLYRAVVGAAGILFAEIPLMVVRSRVIAGGESSTSHPLPVVFYIWLIKDSAFIVVAVAMSAIYVVRVRRNTEGRSCNSCGRMAFDNPDVFFAPEKRDTYIAQQHGLSAPGQRRDHLGEESLALRDDPKVDAVSDVASAGGKKSKKCVTFRLDLNEGCSSRGRDVSRPTDQDDSSSDEDDDDV